MRFGYTRDATIRLVWALLVIGATSALMTTLALGWTGGDYPGLNVPRTAGEQITSGLVLVFLWLALAAPFFTAHEVRAGDVALRQGVLFNARIPYGEIEDVGYGTRRPIGLGVRWYPDALFVITWPANLVEIRLKRRHFFRLFWIIPLPPVKTIAVNVDEPDRFIAALRDRLSAARISGA